MKKTYQDNQEEPLVASELVAAYGQAPPLSQATIATSRHISSDAGEGSIIMDVEREVGERRAKWGRENFDRLLAEAEELYGYEKGNDFTVDQYFDILRYTAEQCYEAIPEG